MKFKRLSAILLSGLLLANSLFVVSSQAADAKKLEEEEEIVYELVDYTTIQYNSPYEKLATMKMYDEAGDYQLWALEETGEIALVTKGKDGAPDKILFSNPYDVAAMNKAVEPKQRLLSQVILKYSDGTKEVEMNSYVEAAKNRQIKLEVIRGGIRVNYTMGREQARILVPEMIEKSRFEEEILNKMPKTDADGKKIYDENIKKNPYDYMKAFFSLKDPNAVSKSLREDMYKTFPITEKYAIYILGKDSTVRDKKQLEYLISTYTDYTFDDIDADHTKVEYEATIDKLPLFKVAIEYFLDENGLTVTVPSSDIRFDSSTFSLTNIRVLPYFGAGANDETGFTLINDGSGSVVKYEDVKDATAELTITSKVYGQDYSFHQIGGENQEIMRLPAFGNVSNIEYYDFDTDAYKAAVDAKEIIPYDDVEANKEKIKEASKSSKNNNDKKEESIAAATKVEELPRDLPAEEPAEGEDKIVAINAYAFKDADDAQIATVELTRYERYVPEEEEAAEGEVAPENTEAVEEAVTEEAPAEEAATEEAASEETAEEPEVLNDYVKVTVKDAEGKVVEGAVLKFGSTELKTDANGAITYELEKGCAVLGKLAETHSYQNLLQYVVEGDDSSEIMIDPVTGLPVIHPRDNVNIAQSGKYVKFDDEKIKNTVGFIAYIEEGESLAEITTAHGGTVHDYNSTYATFCPRPSDAYELEGLSATGTTSLPIKSKRKYTGNFTIKYIPVVPENGEETINVADMARALRGYLESKGVLTKIKDDSKDIPLYIETFGSIKTTQRVAGIPFEVQTPLTTFADAKKMLQELTGKEYNTTSNIVMKYTGWYNGGLYKTVPSKIKVEKEISKDLSLSELTKYAESVGAKIYPDLEFTYVNKVGFGDGFNYKDDAVQTIDGRTAVHKVYSALFQMFEPDGQLMISPLAMDKYYKKISDDFKALGASGISVGTLGSDLSSDHNEDYAFTREDSKEAISELLSAMKKDNKSVLINGGNAYALKYADHILNVPLTSSENVYASEAVPFVGMVLHGYKSFAGTALNLDGDYDKSVLKAIENGASPYFILSYQHENTSELKSFVDFSKYYSIRYNIWLSELENTYNTLNGVLSSVKYETIEKHETVDKRIVRTTYSNGEQFVLNYNIDDYTYILDGTESYVIPQMGALKFTADGKAVVVAKEYDEAKEEYAYVIKDIQPVIIEVPESEEEVQTSEDEEAEADVQTAETEAEAETSEAGAETANQESAPAADVNVQEEVEVIE